MNFYFNYKLLNFLRRYDIEHHKLLEKKREENQKMLEETLAKGTEYLENFNEERVEKIELAKVKNRFFYYSFIFVFL